MAEKTDPEITIQDRPALPELMPSPTSGASFLVQLYPVEPTSGTRCELKETRVMLGRETDCDIRIIDRTVSRHHAHIEPESGGHRLVDLNSTNGTYVNESRITSHRLQDGDTLYIGNAVFRFLVGGSLEAAYHQEIHRLAVLDGLTGIPNQRYFMEVLGREMQRALRYHRPLALLLFDIDSFKRINDSLGHLGGDFALRELVACVLQVLRKEALFARYGGEEFAVVLPETTLQDAVRVAERIRQHVAGHPFAFEGTSFPLTVSVGVAATSGEQPIEPPELIRQADVRLYQAKDQGKNRVVAE